MQLSGLVGHLGEIRNITRKGSKNWRSQFAFYSCPSLDQWVQVSVYFWSVIQILFQKRQWYCQ